METQACRRLSIRNFCSSSSRSIGDWHGEGASDAAGELETTWLWEVLGMGKVRQSYKENSVYVENGCFISHESMSQWVRSENITFLVETIKSSITFIMLSTWFIAACTWKVHFWHEISTWAVCYHYSRPFRYYYVHGPKNSLPRHPLRSII